MQFALLIYNPEGNVAKPDPDAMKQAHAAYMAFTEALKKSNGYIASHGLAASSTATTVRVRDGKSQVLNGPFVDSKEQLGGIYIIDVADLDAALSWAARIPSAAWGAIEVRPMWGQ
jgi:hypothetical protein